MLSPTKPALAIFGGHSAIVVKMAQLLADSSGFPVVIRPSDDNPALTLLCVEILVLRSILSIDTEIVIMRRNPMVTVSIREANMTKTLAMNMEVPMA
jgi:cobalamin biosynthesis protein CbiG